jgi:hypothetical protein
MKREYDLRKGKRGPVIPLPPEKVPITIRLDRDIVDHFRDLMRKAQQGNYQTLINDALREQLRKPCLAEQVGCGGAFGAGGGVGQGQTYLKVLGSSGAYSIWGTRIVFDSQLLCRYFVGICISERHQGWGYWWKTSQSSRAAGIFFFGIRRGGKRRKDAVFPRIPSQEIALLRATASYVAAAKLSLVGPVADHNRRADNPRILRLFDGFKQTTDSDNSLLVGIRQLRDQRHLQPINSDASNYCRVWHEILPISPAAARFALRGSI